MDQQCDLQVSSHGQLHIDRRREAAIQSYEYGNTRNVRSRVLKELQCFTGEVGARIVGKSRNVSAWMRKAGDKTIFDWVLASGHDDRDRGGRFFCGADCWCSDRHDNVYP